ncbi:MAG: fibronectin type III domain-containing protein [Candidatus Aminicenantes bacterium]|nr:fibronectin type III domain-containing protein [Candidatus Aminicenantes bacterium]
MAFVVAPNAPTGLAGVTANNRRSVSLTWADNSINETGFTVQRASDIDFTTGLVSISLGTNVTAYTDATVNRNSTYYYRVFASNVVGDIDTAGFPIKVAESGFSNTITAGLDPTPAGPTNLTAALNAGPSVLLSWTDNAVNETGFVVERAPSGGAFATIGTPGPRTGTGTVTFSDATAAIGSSYDYRVKAVNGALSSAYSNTATIAIPFPPPAAPAAPGNVVATAARQGNNNARITLTWLDNSNNETGFTVQYATNAGFTAGVVTVNRPANSTNYQTGNLPRGATYYFRIQAVTGISASAWVNANGGSPIITP